MHKVQLEFAGRLLTLETGRMAKQADGAVVVTYGDSVVLATACATKKPRENIDYFPLMIDYREKMYAAGKIPGSFFRREGRPTTRETIISRVIDRPIRPLFPEGFRYDVQVLINVLCTDAEVDPDIISILGASASLCISQMPFEGPISGVRIGRIDEKFVINPTYQELEISELDLVVVSSENAVVMVEGSAIEVPEPVVLEALELAFNEAQKLNALQRELVKVAGKQKKVYPAYTIPAEIYEDVKKRATAPLKDALGSKVNKNEREALVGAAKDAFLAALPADTDSVTKGHYKEALHKLDKVLIRQFMRDTGERLDGRKFNEIRPITCEVGVLPRTHGSALFTRGETQALVVITLGTTDDEQIIDDITNVDKHTFMLHYNFPPFSVGEVQPIRGTGRREIGHGNLAERALVNVVPPTDEFPYTVRIVSEILESNGSSSMASVCGGTLALMDGGVKIAAPVSGIAMGLIQISDDDFVVLSDIAGWEDHAGDMDFKITGTPRGITAIQMDMKIKGLSFAVLRTALEQALEGRTHIQGEMNKALAEPRADLSKWAPRVIRMMIPVDKIKEVIGPGGKMIKSIIEETGCKIEINEGVCLIYSSEMKMAEKAKNIIDSLIEDVEVGHKYFGSVKRVESYGAFVEILPGKDGLLHISQFPQRINDIFEEVHLGDELEVMVVEVDPEGKVRLSQRFDEPIETLGKAGGRGGDRGGDRGPRRDDRGDRGGRGGDRGRREDRPRRPGGGGDRGGRR